MSEIVNLKIDEKLKNELDNVCKICGLTMSEAFNMFAKEMVKKKTLTFNFNNEIKSGLDLNALYKNLSENNDYKYNFYKNNWIIDEALQIAVDNFKNLKERFFVNEIKDFVLGKNEPKICGLYGLRRTGKTVAMFQVIGMLLSKSKKAAYLQCTDGNELDTIYKDIMLLHNNGYDYIFIDEITCIDGFIQCANVLSDNYSLQGIKIVIAGTDSFGIRVASGSSLFDRINLFHTSYIGYNEYKYLFGNDYSLKEYLMYGGTLNTNDFYDMTHTNEYIMTSIVDNIINTIKKAEDNSRYSRLYKLENNNILNKAIEQAILDQNTKLTIETIISNFRNSDLSLSIKNAKKEYNYKEINKEKIAKKLMEKLKIINNCVDINEEDLEQLKNILKEIGVFNEYKKISSSGKLEDVYLFIQNGLRYNQVENLINILLEDEDFNEYEEIKKDFLTTKIDQTVCGFILEHTVINACIEVRNNFEKELMKNMKHIDYYISQVTKEFEGEWDMVIYNNDIKDIYEIKLSDKIVESQYRWLVSDEMENFFNNRFANVKTRDRVVLYTGADKEIEVKSKSGKTMLIKYKNVENFLLNLNCHNII